MFEDRLYVVGGQEGDFKAKVGSPIFKCSRQKEVMQSNCTTIINGEMDRAVLLLSSAFEYERGKCFLFFKNKIVKHRV